MYYDVVYFTMFVFNVPFYHTLSYDLDHSSITLNLPIIDIFRGPMKWLIWLIIQVEA